MHWMNVKTGRGMPLTSSIGSSEKNAKYIDAIAKPMVTIEISNVEMNDNTR